jgi:DNA-binding transcriptional ArsR family regulator
VLNLESKQEKKVIMDKEKLLNLEIRRKIYDYIKDNPGLHLHELARKLKINYHNLRYHLKFLEKHNMVDIKSGKSYSRVYLKGNIGKMEKDLFNIIRQKTPRNIILTLINYVVCSQNDFSEILEKHPTTIEYHLKKLIDMDIIYQVETKEGITYINYPETNKSKRLPDVNEKLYSLKDPSKVIILFWNYKETLKNDDVFKVTFQAYLEGHRRAKKRGIGIVRDIKKNIDSKIDLVLEKFFDIFPPPYIT